MEAWLGHGPWRRPASLGCSHGRRDSGRGFLGGRIRGVFGVRCGRGREGVAFLMGVSFLVFLRVFLGFLSASYKKNVRYNGTTSPKSVHQKLPLFVVD